MKSVAEPAREPGPVPALESRLVAAVALAASGAAVAAATSGTESRPAMAPEAPAHPEAAPGAGPGLPSAPAIPPGPYAHLPAADTLPPPDSLPGPEAAALAADAAASRFADLAGDLDAAALGEEMHAWMAEVFPLCRSITGKGVRLTLRSLAGIIPLRVSEVPTGTRCYDWTIPREWEIREAWIKDPDGRTVVDFGRSNLHVVGYSVPVRARMTLEELRPHLHSLPDRPDWIPYRHSYWREDWGFCLPHRVLEGLKPGGYEVHIDSSLVEGSLTYGECRIQGRGDEEILISSHCCHPSLANDNLSGMAVAAFLARHLARRAAEGKLPRYSYRFLFAPVTIGAVAWLSRNEALFPRIRHGMVLSLLGDSGPFTWKQSRRGEADVDRAAAHALAWSGSPFRVERFSPYGYDERQFCSPGIDLPMGCLMRTPFARFPEYHTSGDDLAFVKPASLAGSLKAVLGILDILENDGAFAGTSPKGEPQLGRRGLLGAGGAGEARDGRAGPDLMALLWVLNQADGRRTLLGTAETAQIGFPAVKRAAAALMARGLLREKEIGA